MKWPIMGNPIRLLIGIALLWSSAISLTACFGESSTPRGLFTIAAASPNFPVLKACEVLKASDYPAFTLLYKSFGSDYANISELIDCLQSGGPKPIKVIVYLECGPCRQPRRPAGAFKLVSQGLSIGQLNLALQRGNKKVLADWNNAASDLLSQLPQLEGVTYLLNPGLEDNFTDQSYTVVRSILVDKIADRVDISLSRNPLKGNKTKDALELHGYYLSKIFDIPKGGVINGDGDVFCYENEKCPDVGVNLGFIKQWLELAKELGVIALIYRPEFQGLPPLTAPTKTIILPPGKRYYFFPQPKALKELLRYG